MGIPRFFRTPRPRNFNYVPVYYDKDKEEFEERVKSVEREYNSEIDTSKYSTGIRRGSMRSYYKFSQRKANKSTNLRLLLIVMALMFIAAYLFFGYKF